MRCSGLGQSRTRVLRWRVGVRGGSGQLSIRTSCRVAGLIRPAWAPEFSVLLDIS